MKRLILLTLIATTVLAGSSWAAIPAKISYQGILTDDNGVVVADGTYSIRFRLYAAPAGGVELWEETQSVPVANGRFNVMLGDVTPLSGLAFDGTYYLALKIESDTEMADRIPLASSPYALNTRAVEPGVAVTSLNGLTDDVTLAAGANVSVTASNDTIFIAAAGSAGLVLPYAGSSSSDDDAFKVTQTGLVKQGRAGNFEIVDPGNNNNALRVATDGQGDALAVEHTGNIGSGVVIHSTGASNIHPALDVTHDGDGRIARFEGGWVDVVGTPSWGNAGFEVYKINMLTAAAKLFGSDGGGYLALRDTLGNTTATISKDGEDAAGRLALARNSTQNGFLVGCNQGSILDPRLIMGGDTSGLAFNMGIAGNSSIGLPNNSIASMEILDEPGAASNTANSTIDLSGGYETVISASITVPDTGFVFVIGSCQASADPHTTGTTTSLEIGVSDVSTSLPLNQDLAFYIEGTAPTGLYAAPVTAQGLFEVASAGTYTYYLLARQASGDGSISDHQLTLLYFPTAYGTVVSTASSSMSPLAVQEPRRSALSRQEVEDQRAASEAANAARIQRELAAMRAQLDAIERELAKREP
jgi:hypothetical protein